MRLFPKAQRNPGLLAVSFAADRIDVAHVRWDGAYPRLTRWESHPHPRDRNGLARIRRNLRLDGYRCIHLLQPADYQLLQTEAPDVPLDELAAALRWRVKDSLGYAPESASVQVLPLPAPARSRAVYAVAAPSALIGQRMSAFAEAGLDLQVIDILETAQRNVAALVEPPGRGVALMTFHGSGGLLTFTCDGELYYARRVEISHPADEDTEATLGRIALELQRSLDYFERQFQAIAIAKLVVASSLLELVPFLARNLYLPVEPFQWADVLDCSAYPALAEPGALVGSLHVIGAALRREP